MGLGNISVNSHIVNVSGGSPDHMVSVATIQLCHDSLKALAMCK